MAIKVTQVKSVIGRPKDQKQTVSGLGLKRIRHSVVLKDTPSIRGMIAKVAHLVKFEETDEVPVSNRNYGKKA